MKANYPNLELIEYIAIHLLSDDNAVITELEEYKKLTNSESIFFDFDITVFPQVWGSTCGGFDLTENGDAVFSGSVMTKEYTTVVHENSTESYIVFFGNRPCYKVTEPTDDFYIDLKNQRMASLGVAKERY